MAGKTMTWHIEKFDELDTEAKRATCHHYQYLADQKMLIAYRHLITDLRELKARQKNDRSNRSTKS